MGKLKKLVRKALKVVGIVAALYTGYGMLAKAGVVGAGSAPVAGGTATKAAAVKASTATGVKATTAADVLGTAMPSMAPAVQSGAQVVGPYSAVGEGVTAAGQGLTKAQVIAGAKEAAPYAAGAYAIDAMKPTMPNTPTALMPDEEMKRRVARRKAARPGSGRDAARLTSLGA